MENWPTAPTTYLLSSLSNAGCKHGGRREDGILSADSDTLSAACDRVAGQCRDIAAKATSRQVGILGAAHAAAADGLEVGGTSSADWLGVLGGHARDSRGVLVCHCCPCRPCGRRTQMGRSDIRGLVSSGAGHQVHSSAVAARHPAGVVLPSFTHFFQGMQHLSNCHVKAACKQAHCGGLLAQRGRCGV